MTEPSPDAINPFRQRLLAGERLIGCWLSLGTPVTTEVMGLAGFDWLLLDAEHAPNDVVTLGPQLMALKDSPSVPVVRPPWNDTVAIKRLLDAGFMNFLVPFVENAGQASAAVRATRYPPAGVRGVSVSHRGNRYGSIPGYLERINDEIAVAVQIENRAGVDAAAEDRRVERGRERPTRQRVGVGVLPGEQGDRRPVRVGEPAQLDGGVHPRRARQPLHARAGPLCLQSVRRQQRDHRHEQTEQTAHERTCATTGGGSGHSVHALDIGCPPTRVEEGVRCPRARF